MNALEKYFDEAKEGPTRLALRIGRSPSTVTRAIGGKRNPSAKLARAIERGTDGKVTAAEFLAICMAKASETGETP